jgi:hypothetical protein
MYTQTPAGWSPFNPCGTCPGPNNADCCINSGTSVNSTTCFGTGWNPNFNGQSFNGQNFSNTSTPWGNRFGGFATPWNTFAGNTTPWNTPWNTFAGNATPWNTPWNTFTGNTTPWNTPWNTFPMNPGTAFNTTAPVNGFSGCPTQPTNFAANNFSSPNFTGGATASCPTQTPAPFNGGWHTAPNHGHAGLNTSNTFVPTHASHGTAFGPNATTWSGTHSNLNAATPASNLHGQGAWVPNANPFVSNFTGHPTANTPVATDGCCGRTSEQGGECVQTGMKVRSVA